MQSGGDDFVNSAVEIIPGRFVFVWIKRPDSLRTSAAAAAGLTYCVDEELQYMPFFGDFGPLNLGLTYRFCRKTNELLQEAERRKCRLYCYTGPHGNYKANTAVLIGIYQVIYLHKSAEDAYKPLSHFKPFIPFRDASCGVSSFHLTVLDCIKGIQKARDVGFIDWNSGHSTFDLEDYELFEQVENGDMNWVLPGKLLAFSGPASRGNEIPGYRLFTPEDYWDVFRRKGVTTIIRLNKKSYDRKRFTDGGFKHIEMYFPDGSCPADAILFKFLEIAEAEPGALAIHCKAGLGRTGVLICCFIMKHYKFTAEEMIGYIRICRPGSVIGPQQNYLREMEPRMWHEGEIQRAQRIRAAPTAQDLAISGQPAVMDAKFGPSLYSRQSRTDSAPSSAASISDVALSQYRQHYGTASTPPASHGGVLAPNTPPNVVQSVTPRSSSRYSGPTAGRSITPQRYGSSGYGSNGGAYGGGNAGGYGGSSGLSNHILSQPSSLLGGIYSGSNRNAAANSQGRSPSADPRAASNGLRTTMHTDTLRAADRPRVLPERNTQSAEMHGSWAKPSGSPYGSASNPGVAPAASYLGPQTPARLAQGGIASQGGIATRPSVGGLSRGLAPNGQPRKVPAGMLGQYMSHPNGVGAAAGRPASSQQPMAMMENGRSRSVSSLSSMRNQLHSK